MFWIDAGEACD